MKTFAFPIVIILLILAIAAFGGVKNAPQNITKEEKINTELETIEKKAENIKKQIQIEEEKKNASQYKGLINISTINRSSDTKKEYVTIKVAGNAPKRILVTGWKVKSLNLGTSVTIPQSTVIYFANTENADEDIYLEPNDTVYLISGTSPNNSGFKTNKCSGYLEQFYDFTPTLSLDCPLAKNEDFPNVQKGIGNEVCFDYIDTFPRCKTPTNSFPDNITPECRNALIEKMNYPSCISTHRGDTDFYKPEWRIYLKRSSKTWRDKNDTLTLYDNNDKVVDKIEY